MKTRTAILFLLLAFLLTAHVVTTTTVPQLSEQEKDEISKKVEWSGHGNVLIGKLPIFEVPEKDPFFRIVRVFRSGLTESGNKFSEEYLAVDFGAPRSINIGKALRNYRASSIAAELQEVKR